MGPRLKKIAEDWNQDLVVTCHVCYAIDAVSWGLVYQSLLVGDVGKILWCSVLSKKTCHLFFYFLYARSTSIIWMSIARCAFMRSFWPPLDVTLIVHVYSERILTPDVAPPATTNLQYPSAKITLLISGWCQREITLGFV